MYWTIRCWFSGQALAKKDKGSVNVIQDFFRNVESSGWKCSHLVWTARGAALGGAGYCDIWAVSTTAKPDDKPRWTSTFLMILRSAVFAGDGAKHLRQSSAFSGSPPFTLISLFLSVLSMFGCFAIYCSHFFVGFGSSSLIRSFS